MVGEEIGWYALDGLTITILLIEMVVAIMVPGILLSLAIFPKRHALQMSERMALSFGLGLTPAFIIMLLSLTLKVHVEFISLLMALIAVCIVGVAGYVMRGGNPNLVEWYKSKE